MKKLMTLALTIAAAVSVQLTTFAAGWQWIDVDGDAQPECYYFNDDGTFLTNTTTPDGYPVNALGQWTDISGNVQHQDAVPLSAGTYKAVKITVGEDKTYYNYNEVNAYPYSIKIDFDEAGQLHVRSVEENGVTRSTDEVPMSLADHDIWTWGSDILLYTKGKLMLGKTNSIIEFEKIA